MFPRSRRFDPNAFPGSNGNAAGAAAAAAGTGAAAAGGGGAGAADDGAMTPAAAGSAAGTGGPSWGISNSGNGSSSARRAGAGPVPSHHKNGGVTPLARHTMLRSAMRANSGRSIMTPTGTAGPGGLGGSATTTLSAEQHTAVAALGMRRQELVAQLDGLKARTETLQKECESLRAAIHSCEVSTEKWDSAIAANERTLQDLTAAMTAACEKYEECEAHIAALKAKNRSLTTETETMTRQAMARDAHHVDISSRTSDLNATKLELQHRLSSLDHDISQMTSDRASLLSQVGTLAQRIDIEQASLNDVQAYNQRLRDAAGAIRSHLPIPLPIPLKHEISKDDSPILDEVASSPQDPLELSGTVLQSWHVSSAEDANDYDPFNTRRGSLMYESPMYVSSDTGSQLQSTSRVSLASNASLPVPRPTVMTSWDKTPPELQIPPSESKHTPPFNGISPSPSPSPRRPPATAPAPAAPESPPPIQWTKGQAIGEGAFSNVFLGMDTSTGQLLAVKQLKLDRSVPTKDPSRPPTEMLREEIQVMQRLKHPHIVRYLGTSVIADEFYILLEYMPGGSINNLLHRFGPFSEDVIKQFTRQILAGLAYLHSEKLVHRDIKGGNILVDNAGQVKLADFGCSTLFEGRMSSAPETQDKILGSVPWMAPEVARQERSGRKSDIWSVGCTVIEMATGQRPWSKFKNQLALLYHIGMTREAPPGAESLSESARDFLSHCFDADPARRWSAQQLLEHPWLRTGKPNHK